MREVKFTNTLTREKEVFKPIEPGVVKFYSCGPTVYDFIHIGNLRGALVSDLIYRYLSKIGYDVHYVRNYTDIDDKIINKSKELKRTAQSVSEEFIQEVERDYAVSGAKDPTHKPKATQHVREMIEMIQKLIDKKVAYVVDGEVLYAIEGFQAYGKLSKKNLDELEAGARVEVDRKKKNPFDFTLWKPAKEGEPSWQSPWGKGRPGWHIECSAMSRKYLGDQIDIHHGGVDLIFPHHENEIAQSEAASGCAPFSRFWIHHEFLTLSKEKMSKSLGNIFSAREFLKQYGGEVARYLLLHVHYRTVIDFNETLISQSLQSLERIYQAKQKAQEICSQKAKLPDQRAENHWSEFVMDCDRASKKIDDHYANDLNTPGALAEMFSLIREFNRILTEPKASGTPGAHLGAQALIQIIEKDIGAVIGIGRLMPKRLLEELNEIRKNQKKPDAESDAEKKLSADAIEALLEERVKARQAKDFKRSDEIRDTLKDKGVLIQDGPEGTTWKYQ